ncbi:thioredoxin domain-containing protein [Nitratireductor luteus]|uniref:thioredoxin domain-containing protein n=1 Tax=Nitratireductor luteus TaxID=2976980 RepID=UPI00223EED2B|nr:thioredoxin domain-containing protein [Nitratireductor luteus]
MGKSTEAMEATLPLPAKNLLSAETSPYLKQHQSNPVHWRPWSEAALSEARELDRPILLSIGYAACHWCHVMAHESFEDHDIADLMNRLFVNIKVDREERPDIDQIYMAALTATGEQGGWPLTMFLTPEAKPFWGGTYFPPIQRFGRPGFRDLLVAVHQAWTERNDDLTRSAEALNAHVEARLAPEGDDTPGAAPPLEQLALRIHSMIDGEQGGLRGAPKFPNTPFMNILWLNWLERANEGHRDAVIFSLRKMLSGGIYDHIGGGLARYATDARWLVPHFEKMLYDNAQLISLTSQAFAATGDPLFRTRIEETINWLLRDMRTEAGAFASSLDADSEGEEGKYYLWTEQQIREVLGPDTERFLEVYELARPEGWEGEPILHRSYYSSIDLEDEPWLAEQRAKLLAARQRRLAPSRDDKVLVDWNGMAIAAIAHAGRQLQRADWVGAATAAFHFISESTVEGRLPHSIGAEKSQFPALSSDYAAMIHAAVAVYQATGDPDMIAHGVEWYEALQKWHAAPGGRGHFLTASDASDVPIRVRGDIDEATPSATAQIIEALAQLSMATGNQSIYDAVAVAARHALSRISQQAYGQAGIVYAASLAREPMKLLVVDDEEGTFSRLAAAHPDPRRVDILLSDQPHPSETASDIAIDRTRPGAWLCIGTRCLPSVRSPKELEALLPKHIA